MELDPRETNNLAAEQPAVVARLARAIAEANAARCAERLNLRGRGSHSISARFDWRRRAPFARRYVDGTLGDAELARYTKLPDDRWGGFLGPCYWRPTGDPLLKSKQHDTKPQGQL